jgi:hypothetical protein
MLALLLLCAAPELHLIEGQLVLRGVDDPKAVAADLQVFVEPYAPGQPAMLGNIITEPKSIRFEPRFGLTPGLSYRVRAGTLDLKLTVPRVDKKPTTTVAVYPSRDALPENLLKFYLHFSAPMTQGDIYRHVKLLDAAGKAIDMPFLELDEELWDASGQRLTLFIDPGRIKRGLKPREDIGPVLEEGKTYTLVIDAAWRDADDVPMKSTYKKTFKVSAPDESQPDIQSWKLAPPTGREPLVVTFPKPMDHALLHRLLWVSDARGEVLPGSVRVSDGETRWTFTPRRDWPPGDYFLVADTRLEDLSGNSLGRPFELDILRPVEKKIPKKTVQVPFRVK